MRQKVCCTRPHACIRRMRGTRGRHETKSSARLIIATIFREKLFLSTKFFAQFILCIHYTLLNSIWRDKPQYRMQGWATSGGGESGRRHRDPLPSPSSPGHSYSLRAQESVIEDGQTGERRAVVTYLTVSKGCGDCRKVTGNRMDPTWSVKGSLLFW